MTQERVNIHNILQAQETLPRQQMDSTTMSKFEEKILNIKHIEVDAKATANTPLMVDNTGSPPILQNEIDLDDLGLDSFEESAISVADGEVLGVEEVDAEAIQIGNISDKFGKLSDKIDSIAVVNNLAVVSLRDAGILAQVSSLMRHDIVDVCGVRYAMKREPRESILEIYKNQICESLSLGLSYEESLIMKITNGSKTMTTLKLSRIEWSYLCKWFSNYNARVTVRSGDVFLTVGI